MALIRSKSGGLIGGSSYPQVTIGTTALTSPDPGLPISHIVRTPTDPMKLWKTQPSLRKVVTFAARQFASVGWHAYLRAGDNDRERLAGSALETILSKPGPLQTGYRLRRDLATDLMIYDLALAVYIEGDKELVRIPPRLIRITSDWIGRPVKVYIRTGPGLNDIDVTDAPKIFTWGWSPEGAGGVSPMHTLAAILEENRRSVQWRTDRWVSTPKTAGLLKRPANAPAWKDPDRDRFLEDWRAWRDANGGSPILEDGMEYEVLEGLDPKTAQDINGRQLTDAEVASAFHIPPELVGARNTTLGSVDVFRQMLFGPTLGPMFVDIQEAINSGGVIEALDTRTSVYVEANREAAMAGGFYEQARILQTMTGGPFMTRAEARGRLNLPHLEGTDELIVPLNVTEGGLAAPDDTGTQNEGGDNAAPENRED